MVLTSERTIRLMCGASSLVLTPDRIELVSDHVLAVGRRSLGLAGGGASASFAGSVEIAAKSIGLFSSGAGLALKDNGDLWGGLVRLNCVTESGGGVGATTSPEPTKRIELRFIDEDHQPYGEKTFHMTAGGQRFRGTTHTDGVLVAMVPTETEEIGITLWVDEYPEGRRIGYDFLVADLPPADVVRGAKHRLKNLGYYHGPVDDLSEPDFEESLAWFRVDQGYEPSRGPLDEPTAGLIAKVYGH